MSSFPFHSVPCMLCCSDIFLPQLAHVKTLPLKEVKGKKNLNTLVSKSHISWYSFKHKHFPLCLLGFEGSDQINLVHFLIPGPNRCSVNVEWINKVTEQEFESSPQNHCSIQLFCLKLRVMPAWMGRSWGHQTVRTRARRVWVLEDEEGGSVQGVRCWSAFHTIEQWEAVGTDN